MDLLKRELAPVLPEAWAVIDEEARRVLATNLAGRKLVEVDGPHGWELGAVNLGRLDLLKEEPVPDVHVGLRTVQPLLEFRIPLTLRIMELDYIARGARDPEIEKVQRAAEKAALAEDRAIFLGYKDAGISGIIESSPHPPLSLSKNRAEYLTSILEAREILRGAGISGPYGLAVGLKEGRELALASQDGYPVEKRVREFIEGPIVAAGAIEGMVLISMRGGDFILTVGQDLSIGYAHQEKHTVELYITESFTFRVVEPSAAIYIRPPSK